MPWDVWDVPDVCSRRNHHVNLYDYQYHNYRRNGCDHGDDYSRAM
jgi:hypothetical protein